MSYFKRKGEKTRYSFSDKLCIGRACWAPGMYQHRSPLACGGSRNTGSPDSPCCLNRAHHGCPDGPVGEHTTDCDKCNGEGSLQTKPAGAVYADDWPEFEPCYICGGHGRIIHVGLPSIDPLLAKERKLQGWKSA